MRLGLLSGASLPVERCCGRLLTRLEGCILKLDEQRQENWPRKYKSGCWGRSVSVPSPGEECPHKGTAVVVPPLFPLSVCSPAMYCPTPPRPNTGSFCLLLPGCLTSSYHWTGSGQVVLYHQACFSLLGDYRKL